MIVHVYGKPFHLLAVGWGTARDAEAALEFAVRRLSDGSTNHNLTAIASIAAITLGCPRGSYTLRPARAYEVAGGQPTFGRGDIENRVAAMLARPANGTRRMTAMDVARRLDLDLDIGTARFVGAALRRQLGPPRTSSGMSIWEVPNVWL